jgi:hypothetical protein
MCQIVIGLGLVWWSCNTDRNNIGALSAYYFDVTHLPDSGLTYNYRNLQDSLADPETWHFQRVGVASMESINYDGQGEIVQRQYERFVENGVLIDSLILYSTDSLGVRNRVPVRVISPNRFPFNAIDTSHVWLTHLDWYQPGDSLHIVLQRRRIFSGFTQWKWDGHTIPAIRFRTEDTFETERDGWTNSSWYGEEIYGKGLGLVYYKRKISDQMILEFELSKQGH